MATVYLGFGSNIGSKEENVRRAIELLKEHSKIINVSSNYKTEPWGITDQDWFINAAAIIETTLSPTELLAETQRIEKELGRTKTVRYGPRTIDIDILFYEDKIVSENNLTIPHPGAHERSTVLLPLCEIASHFVHPILKKTIKELAAENPPE